MKTISILLLLLVICTISQINAQETKKDTIKCFKVSDIYIQGGVYTPKTVYASLDNFRALATNSEMLNKDFLDYKYTSKPNMVFNGTFSVLLGINIPNKEKTKYRNNPQIRMGFTYFSGMGLYGNLYKRETKPFDTLTSSQTGEVTYIDSVLERNYNINYSAEHIRYDASIIFRSDPKYLLTVYTGLGITAGCTFNAETKIEYSEFRGAEERTSNSYESNGYNYSLNSNEKSEIFTNKNSYSFSVYVPLGIDFRLAKRNKFWRQIQLCYEFRPCISIVNISELYTIQKVGAQNLFGIRYSVK